MMLTWSSIMVSFTISMALIVVCSFISKKAKTTEKK